MSRLLPCPSCQRHVKADVADQACPFCQAAVPAAGVGGAQTSTSAPLGRMSRIAVLAAGATLLTAAVAPGCDGTPLPADGGVAGRDGAATGGGGGATASTGGATGAAGGGGSSPSGTGGGATPDGGQPDVPIAIYAAAVALPRNRG